VHVFESREQERVLLEPGAPPPQWFLPWVELGMDDPVAGTDSMYRVQLLPYTAVTPEVTAAVETVRESGVAQGQEALARALHDFVNETLDRRSSSQVYATDALLSHSGNPALLYSSLLDAAGITNDLVWSRGTPPAADGEPEPRFYERSRPQRRLHIVVRPDDGPEAWCDMASRTMPYGQLMGDEPGAEARTVKGGESIQMPDDSRRERPGVEIDLEVDVAADGSAMVRGQLGYLAGLGFAVKEQLEEAPEIHHRSIVENVAADVLPGISVEQGSISGLKGDERIAFHFEGSVERFLDPEGGRPLPLQPLELSRGFAIEGQRTLPFLQGSVSEEITTIALRTTDGFVLRDPPEGLRESFEGYEYSLSCEEIGDGQWSLVRSFSSMPFSIGPDRYPELIRFAQRVDDAERGRLRFGAPGGGSAGAASESASEAGSGGGSGR